MLVPPKRDLFSIGRVLPAPMCRACRWHLSWPRCRTPRPIGPLRDPTSWKPRRPWQRPRLLIGSWILVESRRDLGRRLTPLAGLPAGAYRWYVIGRFAQTRLGRSFAPDRASTHLPLRAGADEGRVVRECRLSRLARWFRRAGSTQGESRCMRPCGRHSDQVRCHRTPVPTCDATGSTRGRSRRRPPAARSLSPSRRCPASPGREVLLPVRAPRHPCFTVRHRRSSPQCAR